MADVPVTRSSLLVRLRDTHDQKAWQQFVGLYAPVVYGYARKRGLQDADAGDLTQEVLRGAAAAHERLDAIAQQGSFHQWLFTVAHHKLHDFLARQHRQAQGSGNSEVHRLLDQQPQPNEDTALWEQEYQQQLFAWAAQQIESHFQASTWQAFWQTAVEGKSGKEVAQALGMTVAAVYLAKSRVLARLREQIQELDPAESP